MYYILLVWEDSVVNLISFGDTRNNFHACLFPVFKCMYRLYVLSGSTENFQDSFADSDYSAGAISIAFYSGFWAFGGW